MFSLFLDIVNKMFLSKHIECSVSIMETICHLCVNVDGLFMMIVCDIFETLRYVVLFDVG